MRTETRWMALLAIGLLFAVRAAQAHCDTLDGPVVSAARVALEKRDVTPVLGWIREEHEAEIRAAFQRTLSVRQLGPDARELADLSFFETLVRLHREGEGEPYTGLKPAGTHIAPAVAAADKALDTGTADALIREVTAEISAGLRERFARALERKQHAQQSVGAARAFVEAYVELTHYAERAVGAPGHGPEPAQHAEHDQDHP